jgi:hypothetical protein
MHKAQYGGSLRDLTERFKAFELLFEDDGDRLANIDRLLAAARRGVAREALVLARKAYQQGRPDAEEAAALAELVAFAEETWPLSRDSRLRHVYDRLVERAARGKAPILPAALTGFRDRVSDHLRWRRWRRTGIDGAMGSFR